MCLFKMNVFQIQYLYLAHANYLAHHLLASPTANCEYLGPN